MSYEMIDSKDQFSAGADLWVFSGVKTSNALKKVDWFLNYLLFNSNFKDKSKPLLLNAFGKLPTQFVLSIPFDGDIDNWSQKISEIYTQLGKPSLRIFLPTSYNDPNNFPTEFDSLTSLVVE